MASIQSSTELSRELRAISTAQMNGDFDTAGQFDVVLDDFQFLVLPFVAPVLEILSSTQIVLAFEEDIFSTFRVTLQGSGIGPVNTLEDLGVAIENGVASGSLGAISLSKNNVTVLNIAIAPGGYTLTTGVDTFRLTGAMPTTFAQMFDLAGLLRSFDLQTLDTMLPTQRAAYFADLAAYGITGFAVETGGDTLVALAITPTTATLTIGDLSFALTGVFPDDFGSVAALMHEIYAEFTSVGAPVDLAQVAGIDLTGLVITSATAGEVLRLNGPFHAGEPIALHTITGTSGDDATDLAYTHVGVLTANLLGGNDTAQIDLYDLFAEAFYLGIPLADQTQITLNGGTGTDTLQVTNYIDGAYVTIHLGTGQIKGTDFFDLSGDVLFDANISGFETVVLVGADFNVLGSAANETVRLSDGYWSGYTIVTFDGGAGTDTLDVSGTAQSNMGYIDFFGLTLAQLTADYEVAPDGSGGLMFSSLVNDWTLPDFRLLNVENLTVLAVGGGTQTVTVASLAAASYALQGEVDFTGSYLSERITGVENDEHIYGRGGSDVLIGAGGNDTLEGGNGGDTLNGGTGDDFIFGGSDASDLRDVIYGGDGHDSVDGGYGNDDMSGGNGNDTVLGGFGADTLVGNDGNDLIGGGAGGDLMSGNAGNDTLNGGFGYDRMNGGTGADSFYHLGVAGHASDWVQDYNATEGDVLTVGIAGALRSQFQINTTFTPGAGSAGVAEAFVVYRPTGQILWALIDGADDAVINANIGGQVFDLTA